MHGPLGEGFARGPGGGLQGGRVHQEGRATSSGKEEDEAVAQSYHDIVLSGKLQQAVCLATNREGGGCILPEYQCTKTGRSIAEVLQ